MRTVALNVDGMQCPRCVEIVEAAIKPLPGVNPKITTCLETSTVIVMVEDQTNNCELIAAVRKAGYEATVVAPD